MRTKWIHHNKSLSKNKSRTKTIHKALRYATGSYVSVTTSRALGVSTTSVLTEFTLTASTLNNIRNNYVVDIPSFDARPDQNSTSLYIPPYNGVGWTRTITLDQEIFDLLKNARYRSVTSVGLLVNEAIVQFGLNHIPIVTRMWQIQATEPFNQTESTTINTIGITFHVPYVL